MVSFRDRIPKKHHVDVMHCVLCKKHGGTHSMHNTMECRNNEKNGTPKMSFTGKSVKHNLCSGSALHKQKSYTKLSAKFTKPEKSNKKLKHANKKRKSDRDSDSDDSKSS
jgi:hypothetical protein